MTRSIQSRRSAVSATLALLILLSAGLPNASASPADVGEWGTVMDWKFQGKHLVLLPNGKVLAWATGDSARVWDPVTGSFTLAPANFGDLHCAAQATLADGRVIVIGGVNGPPHTGINLTSIFDPSTNAWANGARMHYERWYGTATTLADGRVLATSGDRPDGTRATIPEIYDPLTDTWTELPGADRQQGLYPFTYVLPGGKVYEAGTSTGTWFINLADAGSWNAGPRAPFGSSGYSESGAMYLPGRILRAGGDDPATARTETIDMTAESQTWRELSPMAFPRRRLNVTILADGTVMAVGGTRSADSEADAVKQGEIWDPATQEWTTVASMAEGRAYHSASLLLPDGRVLSTGGEMSGRLHAQIYSPPYLFRGSRPVIASAPGAVGFGRAFIVQTPDAVTVASVALIRPSAVTHAIDMNQRYVPLKFSVQSGGLAVTAPADGTVAPPGYYMLVVKNSAGVPSVASWVRLEPATDIRPGAVGGVVTDQLTGLGIPGARVSFAGGAATTALGGAYSLTDIPPGEYAFKASATGWGSVSRTLVVPPGGTETLNFVLSPAIPP